MLDRILADVRRRLPALQARQAAVRDAAEAMPPPRDFQAALRAPGLSVVAEFKRASPSKGLINDSMDPGSQASLYASGGAAAISVLTEPDHFLGSPADLADARAAVSVPVLRKDFTIDPLQVWEAKAMGADAVLLIAAILDDDELVSLSATCRQARLAALVEVHDETEAKRALAAGARIIGVNNRDLTTFEVDLATAEALASMVDGPVTIAESGIRGVEAARRMAAAGYDAVLVGEHLVRSADPANAVAELGGFPTDDPPARP